MNILNIMLAKSYTIKYDNNEITIVETFSNTTFRLSNMLD